MSNDLLSTTLTQKSAISQEIVNVDEPSIKVMVVEMAGQWFAFYGHQVREILAEMPVYFVPGCPASLEGVINVHGSIESVIQLHSLLHLDKPKSLMGSHILLCKTSALNTGVRVEKVIDMLEPYKSPLMRVKFNRFPPGLVKVPLLLWIYCNFWD